MKFIGVTIDSTLGHQNSGIFCVLTQVYGVYRLKVGHQRITGPSEVGMSSLVTLYLSLLWMYSKTPKTQKYSPHEKAKACLHDKVSL